jgi:hypothetical protein
MVLLVAVMLMTACAPQVSPVTPAAQAVTEPTRVSPANASTPAVQPASASNTCSCFEALSSELDNSTQARIRTVNEVMGADHTTVYVNGLPAMNGDRVQKNIPVGKFSGFLYVKPGVYSITLVPDGGTIDQALFKPVEVKAEAGHRYTVAAMGQLADKDVHGLVVDETALGAGLGAGKTDNIAIDINNLKPAESITELADGKTMAENIKYGEARTWFTSAGSPVFVTMANVQGNSQKIFESDSSNGWAEPGVSMVIPWYASQDATNFDGVGAQSQGTSELNVVDFLAGWNGPKVNIQGHIVTFNTFLKIIDKSGLRDQLVNGGPYVLLAPADEAFSKMSQADLDALLNDPQALKTFMDAHLIDGYYPAGNLSGISYGHSDRNLTNRLGQKVIFNEDNVNYFPAGTNYTVGNGNRVTVIYTLIPVK